MSTNTLRSRVVRHHKSSYRGLPGCLQQARCQRIGGTTCLCIETRHSAASATRSPLLALDALQLRHSLPRSRCPAAPATFPLVGDLDAARPALRVRRSWRAMLCSFATRCPAPGARLRRPPSRSLVTSMQRGQRCAYAAPGARCSVASPLAAPL